VVSLNVLCTNGICKTIDWMDSTVDLDVVARQSPYLYEESNPGLLVSSHFID
jgi:hypothetical protein